MRKVDVIKSQGVEDTVFGAHCWIYFVMGLLFAIVVEKVVELIFNCLISKTNF